MDAARKDSLARTAVVTGSTLGGGFLGLGGATVVNKLGIPGQVAFAAIGGAAGYQVGGLLNDALDARNAERYGLDVSTFEA